MSSQEYQPGELCFGNQKNKGVGQNPNYSRFPLVMFLVGYIPLAGGIPDSAFVVDLLTFSTSTLNNLNRPIFCMLHHIR